MGDTAHISPEQASQVLNLANVDANLIGKSLIVKQFKWSWLTTQIIDILARKDVVTFGSLVRVGLELIRDPT